MKIFRDILLACLFVTVLFFTSCEKEETTPLGCHDCGTPDRLPADLVLMDQLYVCGEFLDVDNDGDLDLVLGAWGDPSRPENEEPTDRLLLNDGNGYFKDAPEGSMPPKLFRGPHSGAADIEPIDANNDGYLDMLLASNPAPTFEKGSNGSSKLQLLINDGTGKFSDQSSLIEHINIDEHHFGEVMTADFDRDGLMDIATHVFSWRNTGSGFEMREEYGGGFNAIADINGDSLPDIIHHGALNEGLEDQGLPGVELGYMVAFDADGDGDNDLFITELGLPGNTALPMKLLLNDGTGIFSYANPVVFQPAPIKFYFGDSSAADFNGDGLIDIFIQEGGPLDGSYPGGQNRILIQKPLGTFVDETAQRLPHYKDFSSGHALGDIDNDGDLDIFNNSLTAGDQVSPSLLLNDGNGYFKEVW